MGKKFTSVLGLDIGRYSLKSVVMQKKGGNRFIVTDFACHVMDESSDPTPSEIGKGIKSMLKQMSGHAKACAVAVSHPEALLRLIEQPSTPTEVLRDALRLNGMMLLNQDTKNFILDCDLIPSSASSEGSDIIQKTYLVAGLPRTQVNNIGLAVHEGGTPPVVTLQLSPVAMFNAFEFAQPEAFNTSSFFLLDIGHQTSTMMLGSMKELVLIRNIDFGGKSLLENLQTLSGEHRQTVLNALENDDEVMIENARMAMTTITREIMNSIGFFEGRREDTIKQIWVSGGVAKCKALLRVLGEELRMPCVAWSAMERCEINISSARKTRFTEDCLDLSVACGAAIQALSD
jgi:type IV pilus assembly protein PilM